MFFASLMNARTKSHRPAARRGFTLSLESMEERSLLDCTPTSLMTFGGALLAPCAPKLDDVPALAAPLTLPSAAVAVVATAVVPVGTEPADLALPRPPTELWACAGPVRRVCVLKNGDVLPLTHGQAGADAALIAGLVAGDTAPLTPQRPLPVFEPAAAQALPLPPTTMIGSDKLDTSGSASIVDSAKIQ